MVVEDDDDDDAVGDLDVIALDDGCRNPLVLDDKMTANNDNSTNIIMFL
jgi:hypothetical protein